MAVATNRERLLVALSASALDNLDQFGLGMIRVDQDRRVTFATGAIEGILGMRPQGRRLWEFVADEDSARTLEDHVWQRFRDARASEYSINVKTADPLHPLPIGIVGVPEINRDGSVCGAIALVRDLRLVRAADAMHKFNASATDVHALLSQMAALLHEVVPYDNLFVTVYSKNRQHVRSIYTKDTNRTREQWDIHWWLIKPYMKQFLGKTEPHVYDPVALVHQWGDPKLLEEPDVKFFVENDLCSAIRLPVVIGDRVESELYLIRRGTDRCGERDLKALAALPLAEIIARALQLDEGRHHAFLRQLIGRIADECDRGLDHIARLTVDGLAEHFDWRHVSILRPEQRGAALGLRLIAQCGEEGARLEEDFWQSVDEGLLGDAYSSRKIVIADDVTDIEFRHRFKRRIDSTNSELCFPVFDNSFFWVVNVEDAKRNAFADRETTALKAILDEVRSHVQRAAMLEHWKATVDAVSDALIVTDARGVIRFANPACRQLLDYAGEDLVARPISMLFVDAELGAAIAAAPEICPTECRMKSARGAAVPVQVTCRPLSISTEKVYVATDLTSRKQMEKIGALKDLFHEIARQTKVPLSIASTMVERARRAVTGDVHATLRAVLPYLRKVDLTFDRMLLFERDLSSMEIKNEPVDVQDLIDAILQQTPETELARVGPIAANERAPRVLGDGGRLTFCFESILSYLLRIAPQDSGIGVSLRPDGSRLFVAMFVAGMSAPEAEDFGASRADWLGAAWSELASGLNTVRRLVERQSGRVHGPECQPEGWGFRFELTLA